MGFLLSFPSHVFPKNIIILLTHSHYPHAALFWSRWKHKRMSQGPHLAQSLAVTKIPRYYWSYIPEFTTIVNMSIPLPPPAFLCQFRKNETMSIPHTGWGAGETRRESYFKNRWLEAGQSIMKINSDNIYHMSIPSRYCGIPYMYSNDFRISFHVLVGYGEGEMNNMYILQRSIKVQESNVSCWSD